MRRMTGARPARLSQPLRLIALLACVGLAFGSLLPLTRAEAYPSRIYPRFFWEMVVDDERGHVFVGLGRSLSSITVLDFEGRFVAEIEDVPLADGMVLDGDTLYASVTGDDSIAVIDAETLEVRERIDLAPLSDPGSVAIAAGKLWFGGTCQSQANSSIASMDLVTREIRTYEHQGFNNLHCAVISSSPSNRNVLLVTERAVPPTLAAYDVSGDPRQIFSKRELGVGYLLPDGQRILTSNGTTSVLVKLEDGSTVRSYSHGAPHAVSADGRYVATVGEAPDESNLYVFDTETSSLVNTYDLFDCVPPWQSLMTVQGVDFSSDGSKVFVAVNIPIGGVSHATGQFHVFPTNVRDSGLRFSASEEVIRYGQSVRFDVRLTHDGPSSNRQVSIYGAFSNRPVVSGAVDGKGRLTVRREPVRNGTSWAQWTGDPTSHECASSRRVEIGVRMAVRGELQPAAGSGKVKVVPRGKRPAYVTSVRPSHPDQALNVVIEEKTSGGWRPAQEGIVAASSRERFEISRKALRGGGLYRVRGYTDADLDHLGGSSRWTYFRMAGG
jgi:hypothetical protein